MLVHNPMKPEQRRPRRWPLLAAGVFLSLAVLAAGVGLGRAAADDTKKGKDPTKEPAKKDDPRQDKDEFLPGFPDIDELLKRLPGGTDEETAKLFHQHMENTRKMMEQMRKQMPGIGAGLLPFPRLNRIPGMAAPAMTEARLGVRLGRPTAAMADQLDLPRGQGLILEDVRDDSAAAKAGLKQHDILLELAGKPVPSDPAAFNKQLRDVKPDEAVEAVVLRKSKKETIKNLKLPKRNEVPQPGEFNPFKLEFNQPFQGLKGALGNGSATTMTRTNDDFTITSRENGVTVSIKGKVAGGKANAEEIVIQEGEKKDKYESVDKVPAAQREKVKGLLEMAVGKARPLNLDQ